jgi:hypothetical protein
LDVEAPSKQADALAHPDEAEVSTLCGLDQCALDLEAALSVISAKTWVLEGNTVTETWLAPLCSRMGAPSPLAAIRQPDNRRGVLPEG